MITAEGEQCVPGAVFAEIALLLADASVRTVIKDNAGKNSPALASGQSKSQASLPDMG